MQVSVEIRGVLDLVKVVLSKGSMPRKLLHLLFSLCQRAVLTNSDAVQVSGEIRGVLDLVAH